MCLCAFRTRVRTRKPPYSSALPQTPTPPYAFCCTPTRLGPTPTRLDASGYGFKCLCLKSAKSQVLKFKFSSVSITLISLYSTSPPHATTWCASKRLGAASGDACASHAPRMGLSKSRTPAHKYASPAHACGAKAFLPKSSLPKPFLPKP